VGRTRFCDCFPSWLGGESRRTRGKIKVNADGAWGGGYEAGGVAGTEEIIFYSTMGLKCLNEVGGGGCAALGTG
jgi:hypothetical protein